MNCTEDNERAVTHTDTRTHTVYKPQNLSRLFRFYVQTTMYKYWI